jgi:hypothetical protein
MIDARQGDGRFGPSQFVPNPKPGFFDPVAPNGTTVLDPTPWAGGVKPFLMESSSQFRSAGPLALDSPAYAAEVNEVKLIGGDGVVTPSIRNPTQTYVAKWWQSNPVASWNDVARQLITRNNLDAAESARLLAMENLAAADAAINDWNDKYHFSFWRPFQAIRRAAQDGNPATSPDLTWTPLLTAPYPDHVSGHLGLDGSHTGVLRMFFGDAPRAATRSPERCESRRACYAYVQQLQSGARRDRRGAHLGGPPLPHRGRAGPGARNERRELRGRELLPARGQPLTDNRRRRAARLGRPAPAGLPTFAAPAHLLGTTASSGPTADGLNWPHLRPMATGRFGLFGVRRREAAEGMRSRVELFEQNRRGPGSAGAVDPRAGAASWRSPAA